MNQILRQKLLIARRASKILQLVPYVRMIALCNSVATGRPKKKSDIDFFIVAKNKHIFTVRYGAVFLLTIFGLKPIPRKGKIKDKICLSLFLNNNLLNLDRLNNNKKEEKQRTFWILDTIPLFDENNTYLDFVDKNSWVKRYYKNFYIRMSQKSKNIRISISLFIWRKILEFILFFGIGWLIEKTVRAIQIKRLLRFKHAHFSKEKMIINDQIIKLHFKRPQDKKPLF